MVVYRVQVKNPHELKTRIVERYGTIKKFCLDSGMSESTIHRILKSKKLSYYAANRIGMMLGANFADLFEIINVKEDL